MNNVFDDMLEEWTEDQWIQGTTNAHQQCLFGRLVVKLPHQIGCLIDGPEWEHLTDIIREHINDRYISIQQFNDQPGRNFEHIQTILTIASVKWDLTHQLQEITV